MKRKSCLTLALILVMVQLISVFAVLPAGATTPAKTYEVRKSNVAPTVDGAVDAIWGFFETSEKFTHTSTTGTYAKTDVVVTAKLLYVDNPENENLIDVYVLVEASNTTNWGGYRCSRIYINGQKPADLHQSGTDVTNANCYNYRGTAKQNGGAAVIFEHYFQLTKEQAATVTFDINMVDGGWSDYGCYSWADTDLSNVNTSSKGTLTFSDTVNYPKTASVYRSAFAPVVDGKVDAIWDTFEDSDTFTFRTVTGNYSRSDALIATAKLLYVENGDLIDVYVLIETKNTTAWSSCNRTTIVINDTPLHLAWSGGGVYNVTNSNYNYVGASLRVGSNGGVYEHHFQLTAEQVQSFKFDMYVLDGGGNSLGYTNSDQGSYSWADTTAWNATVSSKGTLNFVDETKDVISITSTQGASIRVDTAVWNKSGIRFATTVDTDRLAALEADGATVTTGTLIIPTKSLEAVNNVFTLDALQEMTEGTHYYNLVNENTETGVKNEWVLDEQGNELTGTWYGTLYNIRDFGRDFSAVGYVTVTYNNVTTTVYGDVIERNIAEVAQGALDSNLIDWTSEQEAVLNYFIGNTEA